MFPEMLLLMQVTSGFDEDADLVANTKTIISMINDRGLLTH